MEALGGYRTQEEAVSMRHDITQERVAPVSQLSGLITGHKWGFSQALSQTSKTETLLGTLLLLVQGSLKPAQHSSHTILI